MVENAQERSHSDDQEETNKLHRSICQVDASWTTKLFIFGGGFVVKLEDGSTISDSFDGNQLLTPLLAEVNLLFWTMRTSLHIKHNIMHFESDCLQIVKLIEEEYF